MCFYFSLGHKTIDFQKLSFDVSHPLLRFFLYAPNWDTYHKSGISVKHWIYFRNIKTKQYFSKINNFYTKISKRQKEK